LVTSLVFCWPMIGEALLHGKGVSEIKIVFLCSSLMFPELLLTKVWNLT